MSNDNVIELKKPGTFVDDPITDILRLGARKLLTHVAGERREKPRVSSQPYGLQCPYI